MKKPLWLFVLSLVALTVIIAINRWDVPVMSWLLIVFGTVAFLSGIGCLAGFID